MKKLDLVDKEILRLLQKDAQMTTKAIAQHINLSITPVFERIKRLEKKGYIKKYVAILNAEKLEYALTVFCQVRLKQHTKDIGHQFVKDIQSLDEVTACYNTSGDYDFILKIMVSDMQAYQHFVLDKLGLISGIGNTHSIFVMGVIKDSHHVPF